MVDSSRATSGAVGFRTVNIPERATKEGTRHANHAQGPSPQVKRDHTLWTPVVEHLVVQAPQVHLEIGDPGDPQIEGPNLRKSTWPFDQSD